MNTVINQPGVIAVTDITLKNVAGNILGKQYSTSEKNMDLYLQDDIYVAEEHEIFELRYPNEDITVTVL